jgi:hypothetical protein
VVLKDHPEDKNMTITQEESTGQAAVVPDRRAIAEQRREDIRRHFSAAADQYAQAVVDEDWRHLGYDDIESWRISILGDDKRFTADARKHIVGWLTELGMTVRQITAATGAGLGTVVRDQQEAGVPVGTQGNARQEAAREREKAKAEEPAVMVAKKDEGNQAHQEAPEPAPTHQAGASAAQPAGASRKPQEPSPAETPAPSQDAAAPQEAAQQPVAETTAKEVPSTAVDPALDPELHPRRARWHAEAEAKAERDRRNAEARRNRRAAEAKAETERRQQEAPEASKGDDKKWIGTATYMAGKFAMFAEWSNAGEFRLTFPNADLASGVEFTRDQWSDFITAEYKRLEAGETEGE